MLRAYEWTLDWVIRFKAAMLAVTIATLVGTVWLYIIIPKGFFPSEDTGFIFATTEARPDVSFIALSEMQRKVAEIIRADKAVEYFNSTVGPGGPTPGTNGGRIFVKLKPRAERGESALDVIQRLRVTSNTVTGIAVYWRAVQNLNIGGRPSKGEYQYTLTSSDTDTLYRVAPEMQEKISRGRGDSRRDHRSRSAQSADEHRDRSREGRRLRHLHRPGAAGTVQRLRLAPGGDDLHPGRRFSGHPGKQAAIPGRHFGPFAHLPQDLERSVGAAGGGDAAVGVGRPAPGQPPGQPARGDDLVQPGARCLTRPGGRCHPRHRARGAPAGDRGVELPGLCAGVPGFAERAGHPGAGGGVRRLCAARHPL